MAGQFIGAGWAFPLRTSATGGIGLVSGDREITESIRLILATAPGERPMRPEFGCGVHDYVFAPADENTAGALAYEVRRALDRWEPRIEVTEVDVVLDRQEHGTLYIDVRYVHRGTNDPRNLVFPFYVIPSHDMPEPGAPAPAPGTPVPGAGAAGGPYVQESVR
ncbi:GPW/gp25 family protein [Streptomyces sp. TRM 70351]|uniref:GPW/gp25 family protein n=1 Tax=Streptomyces sp. TRM 70351 TaxID=3116552 RepID=UPI002E7B308F|nr:GPW/gp25 family protein [Streptomyces sp. TRM 70351]MEE1927543.1 GPW/gp25 family protein [Streptomyces sp. TRM 70351]